MGGKTWCIDYLTVPSVNDFDLLNVKTPGNCMIWQASYWCYNYFYSIHELNCRSYHVT